MTPPSRSGLHTVDTVYRETRKKSGGGVDNSSEHDSISTPYLLRFTTAVVKFAFLDNTGHFPSGRVCTERETSSCNNTNTVKWSETKIQIRSRSLCAMRLAEIIAVAGVNYWQQIARYRGGALFQKQYGVDSRTSQRDRQLDSKPAWELPSRLLDEATTGSECAGCDNYSTLSSIISAQLVFDCRRHTATIDPLYLEQRKRRNGKIRSRRGNGGNVKWGDIR